jgi:hypothetical protein
MIISTGTFNSCAVLQWRTPGLPGWRHWHRTWVFVVFLDRMMFLVWEWDISLTHDPSFAAAMSACMCGKTMRDDVVRPNVGTFDRKNLFREFLGIVRLIFQLYEIHWYIMFFWWQASRDHQWKVNTSFFKVALLLRILQFHYHQTTFSDKKDFI